MSNKMTSWNIKAYLSKGNGESEIRKFAMPGASIDYSKLIEKLQFLFPDLQNESFTTSWKDDENELIVISSNEELALALQEVNSNVLKLYVKVKAYEDQKFDKSQSTPNKSGVKHHNVVCDGCIGDIYGNRYTCLQCYDYDLCSTCESKGIHNEHCMLRLTIPLEWKSAYGKRLNHRINKFLRKATAHTSPTDEPKDCPFRKRYSNDSRCEQASSWLDSITTFLNEWSNIPTEYTTDQKKKETGSEQGENKSSTSTKTFLQSFDYLKDHPEIAQFLDPLGIDVAIEVKTNDPAPKADTAAKEVSQSNDDAANANNTKIKESKETDETSQKDNSTTLQKSVGNEARSKSPTFSISSSKSSIENDAGNSKMDDWTLVDTESEVAPTDSAEAIAQPAPTAPSTQNDTKNVNEENNAINDSLYPSLPNISDNIWHPNPKIQKAVEAMMQMGFPNEGGWLTELLVSKNGNIDKALDVLQPVR